MERARSQAVLAGAIIVSTFVLGSPASATFPGDTGAIFATAASSMPDGGGSVFGWISPTEFGGSVVDDCTASGTISVAPNGEAIAYSCIVDGHSEIFFRELEGGEPVQLTSNAVDDYDPAFSPNGQRLVYSTVNETGNRRLAILNLATRVSTFISVEGGGFQDSAPAWNPTDPNEIAYVTTLFGGDPDIVLRDLTDLEAEPEAITDNAVGDSGPNYSADGTLLAYSSEDPLTSTQQIHIYNLGDDSDTQFTTDVTNNHFEPAISPDGTILVFSRQELIDEAESRLYAVSMEGGTPALLPSQEEGFNYDHAEWQAFGSGSTCPPTCPPPVDDRDITLNLKGSLKAKGKLTDANADERCIADQKVVIERKKKNKWVKIAKGQTGTGGGYEIGLPAEEWKFRARAPRATIDDIVDVICGKAVSTVERKRT